MNPIAEQAMRKRAFMQRLLADRLEQNKPMSAAALLRGGISQIAMERSHG